MKTKTKKTWRHSSATGYWYYEDDKYGYGHVIRHGPTSWLACGRHKSIFVRRLRDAQAIVEASWR